MQCPNCGRDNAASNRYCTYCGSSLHISEDEGPQGQSQMTEEVRRLRELLNRINIRLDALERKKGIITPTPGPESPPVLDEEAVPSGVEEPQVAEAMIPEPEVKPVVVHWKGLATEPSPPPPKESKPKIAIRQEWEQILGGNWLARIGVLSLIIGVGFFLKYAFDNDWIGPIGQIILGILVGLGMLGGGFYWQRKYPILAQSISGGGIAILYLSIFASSSFYDLVNVYVAFGFLFLVSIVSAVLAIRTNAVSLAIIGILGAFVAPVLLQHSTNVNIVSAQAGQSFWLLVYVIVVDLGVLALSTFRNWRWFTLLALLGSLIIYGVWYGQFGNQVSFLTSEGGLTLIFLIFIGATTLYHFVWRRAAKEFDYAVMVINAAAYFGISYVIFWDGLRAWLGGFSILLALVYASLAYIAIRRGPENVRLGYFSLSIALIFVTIAIPVQLLQLGFTAWTIAWAAEGTILMWLSFRLRLPLLRVYGYVVFAGVVIRLLAFDHLINMRNYTPVINERFLAFTVSIAAMYITAYLFWRDRESLWSQEEHAWSVYPIFVVAANFFTVWILSAELWGHFSNTIMAEYREGVSWADLSGLRSARNLALTGLWAGYAVMILMIGIFRSLRLIRLIALCLLGIPIVKVFAYDVFNLQQAYRIAAFVGLGVLLLVSAYLYQRYSRSIRSFLAED